MDSEPSSKKRRIQTRSPSPVYKLDDEDDTYEPYIPVAQRKQAKLAKLSNKGNNGQQRSQVQRDQKDERNEEHDEDSEEESLREKARKDRTLLVEAQEVHSKKAAEGACSLSCL